MTDAITLDIADGIAVLTLNRPGKLNALDAGMIEDLGKAAAAIDVDDTLRAAILTGAGKAFCAGGDIKAWSALHPLAMGQSWLRQGHRAFDALARLKVPLIAAVNGMALGGGLELAATADFRIAEEGATFALPEAGIGMVPGWSGTQRLVARFGGRAVRLMAMAGEILPAERALALGIVDAVVPNGQSPAAARAWAARIAGRSPVATTVIKQLINAAEGEDAAATIESLAGALLSTTEDLREGVDAFRQKRPPLFKGWRD